MKNTKCKMQNVRGFTLVELLIVIVIIGVLTVVSYMAIQRARIRAMNERMLDDLVAIATALEDYRRDHQGQFPLPDPKKPGNNQNILCYYIDATYAHDCDDAAFRQGMIDNTLLSKRYLREVPTDPRTGSRYVYGVSSGDDDKGKYYQVAGIYELEDGIFEARTVENLAKGYVLPSLIRAFDSPNFVIDKEAYLPYSPDHLMLSAKLDNINGQVSVNGKSLNETLYEGDVIITGNPNDPPFADGSVDIYFSDGSITHLDDDSELQLKHMKIDKNDAEGTVTKILLKLNLGKIWSKVVRLSEKSEFRVETTSSIAGVRGTEFSVDRDGNVAFKSGEVWKRDKAIDNLPDDATVDEIFEIQIPAGNVTTAAQTADYQAYYEKIPLHSGIQPHILSIVGDGINKATITVRNINHFVEEVPLGFDRQVQASHLVAYNAENLSEIISEEDITPHTITITNFDNPIVLRFEDRESGRASGFSPVKLEINEKTNLSEKDIYPTLFIAEKSTLEVSAPSFVALQESAVAAVYEPKEFTLEIIDYDANLTYEVISNSTTICESSPVSLSTPTITASTLGECDLTVTVTLENGEVLSQDVAVQIISETQRLFLEYPADGSTVTAGIIQPRWTTRNAPSGVTFNMIFNGTTVSSNASSDTHDVDASATGSHNWSVEMVDVDGNVIETQSADFEVTEEVVVDFTITDESGAILVNENLIIDTDQVSLDLLATPTDDSLYNYQWSGSLPFENNTGSQTTAGFTVEPNTPTPFSVILEVRNSISGAMVGSANKTITITYEACGNGIVDPNTREVCDPPNQITNKSTCVEQGFPLGGTLYCSSDCMSFNTSACTRETPEQICRRRGGVWRDSDGVCLGAVQAACYGSNLEDNGGLAGAGSDDTGYWDGSSCWVLGEGNTSCTSACSGIGASCILNNTTGSWNAGITVCNKLGLGNPANAMAYNAAPYSVGGDCRPRDKIAEPDQHCDLDAGPNKRICRCE